MRPVCHIVVMAKAPVAGFAKTRLAPALGDAGAARLAERLLVHAAEQAVAAALGPVEICCTPDSTHPAFVRLARQHPLLLTPQGGGDLGERMARALARCLDDGAARALLIGTDAPRLDAAYLRAASDRLADHDAVFGPAFDGGYALVGLRAPAPGLFSGMTWSTPRVMESTRRRLAQLGLRHHELALLADIDEPADLVHLPLGWTAQQPDLKNPSP